MAKKEVTYKFGANTAEVDKKLAQMSSKMKDLGKSMQQFGKSMSLYVTAPLTALGTASVIAFQKQEKAEQGVAAALSNIGAKVSTLLPKYKTFAAEIQKVTTVGDETTLMLMQMGLNMGLSTDRIEEATYAAIGLAKAYNMDVTTAMQLVTRASFGQTQMLTRYGIVLDENATKEEKFQQLLTIGASKFSLAEDEAKTLTGQMQQMRNAVGDTMESIGKIIAEAINPLVNWITKAAEAFSGLDERTKKIVVIIASLAAAVGPLLTVLGFLTTTIIPALVAGGTAIASAWLPITAIILGVMGAFYLFNAEARKTKKIIDELSKESTEFLQTKLNSINEQLNKMESQRLKGLRKEAEENKKKLQELSFGTEEHSKLLIRQAELIKLVQQEEQSYSTNYGVIQKLKKEKEIIEDLLRDRQKLVVEPPEPPTPEPSPERVLEEVPARIESIKAKMLELDIAEPFKKLGQAIYDLIPISDTVAVRFIQMFDAFGNKIRDTREVIIDLGKELSYLATDVLISLAESMGNAFNGGTFKDGLNGLLITVADWAKNFGAILIAAGIASVAFQKSLAANPLLAIGAGVALIAAATAVKGALSQNPMQSGSSSGYSGGEQGSDIFGMRDLGQFSVAVTGTLRADGNELITVIENENKRTSL